MSRDGVVITLVLENKHIGFSIDTRAARQAHLILSSNCCGWRGRCNER